jgi:hypothetical protein
VDKHLALDVAVYIFATIHLAGHLARGIRRVVHFDWAKLFDAPRTFGRRDWE